MSSRQICALIGMITLAACQADVRDAATRVADSDSVVIAIGDSAAIALTTTLMSRVRAEIERAGPAAAISFCSQEAMPLTAALEDSLPDGLLLKRTSERIRNPANAPDSLERVALAYFADAATTGSEMAAYLVQQTSEGWRYYKPITVAPLCTSCHGPAHSIDPEVRRILAERYPNDQATGYSAGDFRGVVRVTVPASVVSSPD